MLTFIKKGYETGKAALIWIYHASIRCIKRIVQWAKKVDWKTVFKWVRYCAVMVHTVLTGIKWVIKHYISYRAK